MNQLKLNLQKLPTELCDKIMTYSYSPQSTQLLEDIRSYGFTLQHISQIYYDKWDDRYEELLIHHILEHNMYGYYLEKCIKIFRRLYSVKNWSREEICNFIRRFTLNSSSRIRISFFWGLLTVDERNEFIDLSKQEEEDYEEYDEFEEEDYDY